MYRKDDELEEPDEDGMDQSSTFPWAGITHPSRATCVCLSHVLRGQHRARWSHQAPCAAFIPSTASCIQGKIHQCHFQQSLKNI